MKIIEEFMRGKISEELCEDSYVITESFAAVIDGVTSKSDFRYEGKTTGKLAAEIVKGVIEQMPEDITVDRMVERINQRMEEVYREIDFPYDRGELGMQAACIVYSDFYREIWMIGDCQALVDGKFYENPKKSDILLSEVRAMLITAQIREETGTVLSDISADVRKTILPWGLKATIFANDDSTEYGYSVINGKKIPQTLIPVISLGEGCHEIVLTSDGYPEVAGTLALTEEKLADVLKNDPECYLNYRSTKGLAKGGKSFDDRTYIRFTI